MAGLHIRQSRGSSSIWQSRASLKLRPLVKRKHRFRRRVDLCRISAPLRAGNGERMSAWFSRLKREREAHNLTATQYLVLCELGRFDRCRLGIFPSHATLAARARCGLRTVQRALQAAKRLGLVEWAATRVRAAHRAVRGPNRYVLRVPTIAVQWLRRSIGQSGRGDSNE